MANEFYDVNPELEINLTESEVFTSIDKTLKDVDRVLAEVKNPKPKPVIDKKANAPVAEIATGAEIPAAEADFLFAADKEKTMRLDVQLRDILAQEAINFAQENIERVYKEGLIAGIGQVDQTGRVFTEEAFIKQKTDLIKNARRYVEQKPGFQNLNEKMVRMYSNLGVPDEFVTEITKSIQENYVSTFTSTDDYLPFITEESTVNWDTITEEDRETIRNLARTQFVGKIGFKAWLSFLSDETNLRSIKPDASVKLWETAADLGGMIWQGIRYGSGFMDAQDLKEVKKNRQIVLNELPEALATFQDDMKAKFGPDWKSQWAAFLLSHVAVPLGVQMGSAKVAYKLAPRLMQLQDANWFTKFMSFVVDGAYFASVEKGLTDMTDYFLDKGKDAQREANYWKEFSWYAILGGGINALVEIINPYSKLHKAIKAAAAKQTLTDATELGTFRHLSVGEKLAVVADDPGQASKLLEKSVEAELNLTTYNGPMKTMLTEGQKNEFVGPLKMRAAADGAETAEKFLASGDGVGLTVEGDVIAQQAARNQSVAVMDVIVDKNHTIHYPVVDGPGYGKSVDDIFNQPLEIAGSDKPRVGFVRRMLDRAKLLSTSERSVITSDLTKIRTSNRTVKELTAHKFLTDMNEIYKSVGGKNKDKLEQALVAGNQLGREFTISELMQHFKIVDESTITAYYKARNMAEDLFWRNNALIVNDLQVQGAKLLPANLDGSGQMSVAKIKELPEIRTDETLLQNKYIAEHVRRWEELNQVPVREPHFQESVEPTLRMGPVGRDDPTHPLNLLKASDENIFVLEYDLGNESVIMRDGLVGRIVKRGELVDPKLGPTLPESSRVLHYSKGYIPQRYETNNHYVVAINGKKLKEQAAKGGGATELGEAPDDAIKFLYGSYYSDQSKRFLEENTDRFLEQGQDLVLINMSAFTPGNGLSVHFKNIPGIQGLDNTSVSNLLKWMKDNVPDVTDEFLNNIATSLSHVGLKPHLLNRGASPMKGPGGAWEWLESNGTIQRQWNPNLRAVKHSQEAWEQYIQQFAKQYGEGNFRDVISKRFVDRFRHLFADENPQWFSQLKHPSELGLMQGAYIEEYRTARAVQDLIKDVNHTLTSDEKFIQDAVLRTADGWSNKPGFVRTAGARALEIFGSDIQEAGTIVKTVDSLHFFSLSTSIYLQQLTFTLDSLAVGSKFGILSEASKRLSKTELPGAKILAGTLNLVNINPLEAGLIAKDAFNLSAKTLTGGHVNLIPGSRSNKLYNELTRSGVMDLSYISEFGGVMGSKGFDTITNLGFATFRLGEGQSRIFAFTAAYRTMEKEAAHSTQKTGWITTAEDIPRKWFNQRGELTQLGVTEVRSRSYDLFTNMMREDAPELAKGWGGVALQYKANLFAKLGEKYVWGTKFSPTDKARMVLLATAVFGTGTIPFAGDAVRAIAKVFEQEETTPVLARLERVKDSFADYAVTAFGIEKEQALQFLEGGLVSAGVDPEARLNLVHRLYLGHMLSDTLSSLGRDGLAAIPAVGLAKNYIKSIDQVIEIAAATQERLQSMGALDDWTTAWESGQTQEVLKEAGDAALFHGSRPYSGAHRMIMTLFALGVNLKSKEEWLTSQGLPNTPENDPTLWDYMATATGFGKDYMGLKAELSTIRYETFQATMQRASEIAAKSNTSGLEQEAQLELEQMMQEFGSGRIEKMTLLKPFLTKYIMSKLNTALPPQDRYMFEITTKLKSIPEEFLRRE